jgi:hypothetical protein
MGNGVVIGFIGLLSWDHDHGTIFLIKIEHKIPKSG